MNTLPIRVGGSSPRVSPFRHAISNTPGADHSAADSIHGDSAASVGNVANRDRNIIGVGVKEELLQIQAWLSPLKPYKRHQDVSNNRLDGAGDWVLQRDEYKSWCHGRDGSVEPTLLCYGGQGVGKTYISSLVVDTLCDQARGKNIAILSLYCDHRAQRDQSAVNLIGGLLRQVAFGEAGIPGEIQRAFDESRQTGGKGLRLPDMVKSFVETISSIQRVFICVDAIDEVLRQHRSEFLRALRQIVQAAPNVRLFLTARPYVRGELDNCLTKGAYIINIFPDQEDITRYINKELDDDSEQDPDLMTENLKSDIVKTILEKASGMFLLVAVNIGAILGETSLAGRKKMLRKVATTGVDLDTVYGQTLQRIRKQKGDRSRLGIEVLMWISHSERPLRIDELRHALAVELESTDLDPENIRPQDTILGACLGLAVVDGETSVVEPIHYTLREYLSCPGVLPDAHKTLAQSCLAYLNYGRVKGLPANNISNLGDMPFLEYSSFYWGTHAKVELSGRAKSLAMELLNRSGNHISATLLFTKIIPYFDSQFTNHRLSGLQIASYFGIVGLVAVLIDIPGCDIDQTDYTGFTPLTWAAHQGNERVMGLLLSRDGVDPDKPDSCAQTPLSWASRNGHEGAMRLLLAQGGVNPDSSDNSGKTPLWWASSSGHEGAVRVLLARGDVNPDKRDICDQTPLWSASRNGHEGVVRLLLKRYNVNPNKPGENGETPLWSASCYGHEGVVRLLLARRDINPDEPDQGGETPLLCASCNGNEGVVGLLLARSDVNPNEPGRGGATPLWEASCNGHEEVVRLLLARDNVNPNTPDNDGESPVLGAFWNGHEGIVGLLLARGDVDPDRPGRDGGTLLWAASCDGREEVVRLLLARGGIDANKPGKNGGTPLWCASRNGYEGVVSLLLARSDVDPEKPDVDGKTPLWWASRNGYEGVVSLLLARGDVDPDKPDIDGKTPLMIASEYRHEAIVALLKTQPTEIPSAD